MKQRRWGFLILAAFLIATSGCGVTEVDYIGIMKLHLADFLDESVPVDPSLGDLETDNGSIEIEVYQSDKIARTVFSSIQIAATGVYEESVFVYPAEGYDFPVLWANLTRFPGVNILIIDFIPLQDIVVNPDYAEEYLEPLKTAKETVIGDILAGAVLDKDVAVRSLAVYAFSPYSTSIIVAGYGIDSLSEALGEYCDAYIDIVASAEMLADGPDKDYAEEKMEAFLALFRENDPGYVYMVKAFGQQVTDDVFEIIF